MTAPLQPPKKKDPQKRTRLPLLPPGSRSRAALALSAVAAEGEFKLQCCRRCGRLQYPPRDACAGCLSVDLGWQKVPEGGDLLAETRIHTSTDLYFRERTPWRIGTVRLDAGPTAIAHLHGDCTAPGRVRVRLMLDRSGQAVIMALPEKDTPHMEDDPQWRELTCDPKFRRVLVTSGRTPVGQAMAAALVRAGAGTVFVGVSEPWRPFPGEAELRAMDRVAVMPLDLTDTTSVDELAAEIGPKVDILINTAEHVRPGGITTRRGITTAREEFETNYFGLLRLAQAFGPTMRFRGADGANSACAWVNILSVHALSNWPEFGGFSASQAAVHSLSQCMRAEMRSGGVRVMNIFTGPIEDEWRQAVPPPKVAPGAVADAVVRALQQGTEDVYVGDVAKDVVARWKANAKVLERELTG